MMNVQRISTLYADLARLNLYLAQKCLIACTGTTPGGASIAAKRKGPRYGRPHRRKGRAA